MKLEVKLLYEETWTLIIAYELNENAKRSDKAKFYTEL